MNSRDTKAVQKAAPHEVPFEVKRFFKRHCFLLDVPSEQIEDLTKILCLPVWEDVVKPSDSWLRDQAVASKALGSSLRMPHNPLKRAFIRGGLKHMPFCPDVSVLCDAHKKLDPRVIWNLTVIIERESLSKIRTLRIAIGRVDIPEEVEDWVKRMSLLGGLWSTPEDFRRCYAFKYADCLELHEMGLSTLSDLAYKNPCDACNLAVLGGRIRCLVDIRAGLIARRIMTGRKNPLLKIIDSWISWGRSEEEQRKVFLESRLLAHAITRATEQVSEWSAQFPDVGELRHAHTMPDWPNRHNKQESEEHDTKDERDRGSYHYGEDDARLREDAEITRQWLNRQTGDMSDEDRQTVMDAFDSNFTTPSAVPPPLNTMGKAKDQPRLSQVDDFDSMETADEPVSPISSNSGDSPDSAQDSGTWVSASVHTANPLSTAGVSAAKHRKGYGGLPTPAQYTPSVTHTKRGYGVLPLPSHSPRPAVATETKPKIGYGNLPDPETFLQGGTVTAADDINIGSDGLRYPDGVPHPMPTPAAGTGSDIRRQYADRARNNPPPPASSFYSQ